MPLLRHLPPGQLARFREFTGRFFPHRTSRWPLRSHVRADSTPDGAHASTSAPQGPKPELLWAKHCAECGGKNALVVPKGDNRWRHVCETCGATRYFNPVMVVGCLVEHDGKVMLCRRAIEPCVGRWGLPAGYLEWGETTAEGAQREVWEEATARVRVLAPFAHLDIPAIGQTYLLFRAALAAPFTFSAGPESQEVGLFGLDELPWNDIAFSSTSVALKWYVEDAQRGDEFGPHYGVIDKLPKAGPSGAFQLRKHALPAEQ